MSVYIALSHYPVYNKRKEVVSTCITGFDLHDIARSALTYGVKRYFVVTPLTAQRQFANRILDFWMDDESLEFNWTRAEAFKRISIKTDLEEAIKDIKDIEGIAPKVIATSAKPKGTTKFEDLRSRMDSKIPYLLLFGTGWGLTEEVLSKADHVLEPIRGISDYNHLSVRSAVAIILDRLIGK